MLLFDPLVVLFIFIFNLILIVIIMKINCILDSKRIKGVYRNIDLSEYRPVGI